MIRNYLKIAWRSLLKQKIFTAVNVLGMSVAISAALMLSLTAYREWSFDNFHEHGKDIYQVYRKDRDQRRGSRMFTSVAEPFADVLRKEGQGVKYVTRVAGGDMPVRYGEKLVYFSVQMTDQDFLKMFSFPLLKGNPENALQQPNQVILTQKTAAALFKDQEAVGKTIEININNSWHPFIVSGVAADIPDNSGIYFEALTRFENAPDYAESKGNWDASHYPLFMQLEPRMTAAAWEKSIMPVLHKYYAPQIESIKTSGNTPDENGEWLMMKTIPLKDFHLTPGSTFGNGSNRFYPWLMLILAIMVIGIACINFINLSVAKSFIRGSEVGLRKALGAMNRQLMIQFWSEAFLLCAIALVLGIIFTVLLLPYYNASFGQQIGLRLFADAKLLIVALVAFFAVTLLAGGYPAWRVSGFNIVQVLKGRVSLSSKSTLRSSLILIQFVAAVALISSTAIIWQQMNFVRSTPLGYNTTSVISIPFDNAPLQALTALRNRLSAVPDVESVTAGLQNLGIGNDDNSGNWNRGFTYKGRQINSQCIVVDYDFTRTLGLQVLAGRDFSKNYGADSSAVVINETMAKQLQEKDPVGTVINLGDGKMRVIGVVKDYHYESLHRNIDPLIMTMKEPQALNYIFVKVNTPNLVGVMQKIATAWKEINPLAKNDPSFLDENARRQYRQDQRFSKVFMSGALLAIFISCMGLFAIAVLVITQRKKEIGIRKVLGASVSSIVVLLSGDFLKLVLVAVLIATPLSWYLMQQWLDGFEFRVSIHWWVFALTGLLATAIAFITISLQSVKAALSNPVESLNCD
ncbi:MAG TPA: ABC transporter permease [Chitinophaga sp.]|uniref:ABC transporter permease n=1 Tax=Chitinophaga sp. TaxID=1869181 RepID=UPI002BC70A94|nr:ABC transporter permease [Chitinophaga sp.]HVI48329.1 ABC transporter permease [Chitinophaga sp.]